MKRAIRWVLSKLAGTPIAATTVFGRIIWWKRPEEIAAEHGQEALDKLVRHEQYHAELQRREGIRYYPKYLWRLLTHGYRNHPEEIEARKVSGQE